MTDAVASVASAFRRTDAVASLPLETTPLLARRGFDLDTPFHAIANGELHGEELDRFELQVGRHVTGYLRAGDDLWPLPIGSHYDPEAGTFGWMPGVGFVGSYDFVFVRSHGGRAVSRQEVRITLHPKGSNRVGPQVVIDTPEHGRPVASGFLSAAASAEAVSRKFTIAGWALDLDDPVTVGVGTVHVWAYPIDLETGARQDPWFLGVAATGGERPDVAAVYGDRYLKSGYGLTVGDLEPGVYDLAVFAWSTVRNAFVPARVVRVHVR